MTIFLIVLFSIVSFLAGCLVGLSGSRTDVFDLLDNYSLNANKTLRSLLDVYESMERKYEYLCRKVGADVEKIGREDGE
jgi:hypothetical protein